MIASLLVAALLAAPALQDSERSQFDFWVGEWSVQNRHLQPDGSWTDGDVTRARITPVCGGNAVLEEWAGPFGGAFMNGSSLRAWDSTRKRWDLMLFWTTDGNAGFGRLAGEFRHGRGEFFMPQQGQQRTRYTFSDALADSVRWDSATSSDAGQTWKTDWIMEFARTRAASEVTQDELFATAWTEGQVSPHPQARELDWMLGSWAGTYVDRAGRTREARMRCKLLAKDCLVLDVFETRAPGESDWDERLSVRGWSASSGAWEAWLIDETCPRLRPLRVSRDGEVFLFEGDTGSPEREARIPIDADNMIVEFTRWTKDCGSGGETTIELARVRDER